MFFNEFLRPRPSRGLLDPMALGLIPPLEGLYRKDLAFPGLWERFRNRPGYRDMRRDGTAVDAVLLSHAHQDHIGDLTYLDPKVPVLTTRLTAFIYKAMQDTGKSSYEVEWAYINPRFPSEGGELRTDRRGPYITRAVEFLDGVGERRTMEFWTSSPSQKRMEYLEGARGTDVNLLWWSVDHSVPGAVGFALETSVGWVGYSGDIRFHGRRGGETLKFAEGLSKLGLKVLLCEGTNLEGGKGLTEEDVAERAYELTRRARGKLVVADFGPRNVERLMSFLRVAKETGRLLAVQPKDLYLLEAIHLASPWTFPCPRDLERLALYADPKVQPKKWERELREAWWTRTVSPKHVSEDPGSFILCFSLWDANDLLDLEGVEGGTYLYSNSRAYDEEQMVDLERLRNWVRHVGLELYGDPDDPEGPVLHTSGHASGQELLSFVVEVGPEVLVPIHTENPGWWRERLRGTGIKVVEPTVGRPIILDAIREV